MMPDTKWLPPDSLLRECFGLSRKENQVARFLACGRSNAEIAAALFISPHTARHHTENILGKLDIRSRAQVAAALLETLQVAVGSGAAA
ncbi:MAG: helix-turn-helix transcriptional regulator [Gemmatimonadetes bacterium]|nr:helix-turn-helix transcriptional regulator [Gemmatimonadota bacterium]